MPKPTHTPTPTQWTITASGGGGQSAELVGCHIQANSDNYQFEKPNGDVVSTAGPPRPTTPFNFPMFNSSLAGSTAENWYITVDTLSGGPSGNQASGTAGNTNFPVPGIANDPPETWTAQAGAGLEEEDDAAAAASAS